jgi:Rod binding domain-containing protein
MSPPTLPTDPQLALQAAAAPKQLTRTESPERAREGAEEFEALFLAQMIEHMFEGIETDGLFGGGHSEEMFRSMLFQEFGKALSRAGGVGIADAVQREILKTQEVE